MKRFFASLFALAFLSVNALAVDISITAGNVLAGSNATVENGLCGATITAGQAVYKDTSAGTFKLADNNGASAEIRTATGIGLNGCSSGQPIRILRSGDITIGGTLTANIPYFLSDSGGICPIADVGSGEYLVLLGIARTTAILQVDIQSTGISN